MATAPISTNPLDVSLNKIMGSNPKKKETDPLSPISYGDDTTFRPGEDVINVSGNPATGATTAEEWTHEVQLENLRRQALETEYQQRAAAEEFAFKSQQAALENARQQAQLGLAGSAEARQQAQYGLTARETEQNMALKAAAEKRAADEMYFKYGGMTAEELAARQANNVAYAAFRGGGQNPATYQSGRAWTAYQTQPSTVNRSVPTAPWSPGSSYQQTQTNYRSGTPNYSSGYAWPSGKVGVGMPVAVGRQ